MATGVFGKSGTLSFTATVGPGAEIVALDDLVSMSIYSEAPTQAQIDDDANALSAATYHTSTNWSQGNSSYERLIAYTAISDPEPESNNLWEKYYAVVRYRLESGAQIQRDVEPLIMHRVEGITSRFDVTKSDLVTLERKIILLSDAEIDAKILVAERFVSNALRSRGIDMQRLDWLSAKDLVRFKASALCCMDLSDDEGDGWWAKAEAHKKAYTSLLDDLILGYDVDDDGDVEPGEEEVKANAGQAFLFR